MPGGVPIGLPCGVPAVDGKVRAGDESGGRRDCEVDDFSDLGGCCEAGEGMFGDDRRACSLRIGLAGEVVVENCRTHGAWAHDVAADSKMFSVVDSDLSAELQNGTFAGTVCGLARKSNSRR